MKIEDFEKICKQGLPIVNNYGFMSLYPKLKPVKSRELSTFKCEKKNNNKYHENRRF